MKREIKVAVERASYNRFVDVRLYQQGGGEGNVVAGAPVVFSEVQECLYTEPTMRFTRNEAQELMDAFWEAGLRPTEGSGSAGALAATQAHLKDMRSLVFNKANEGGDK